MTENRWGGILQSRDIRMVSEEFRKSLLSRMAEEDFASSLNLLNGMRDALLGELSAVRRITDEVGRLTEGLQRISIADDLKTSMERFTGLIGELYHARSSVSTTFALARTFYDSLLATALKHAVEQLEQEGNNYPDLPCAVLVSGEMGRNESVLGNRSGYFFIYREDNANRREYVNELAMRFMAVLSVCFPTISRNVKSPTFFWYGSEAEWREAVDALLRPDSGERLKETNRSSFPLMLATVADMRIVCGDAGLGQDLVAHGDQAIANCLQSGLFRLHARNVAAMPVAIGLFGRFKTVRSGRNKGKFDLKEMAIDPLTASIRLLSLPCRNRETSFSGRTRSILATGNLGVALADRLLIAYQDFMRERIRLELGGNNEAEGIFLDPDQIAEESRERFKSGMEEVTTVQRLVHQQLVEVTSE